MSVFSGPADWWTDGTNDGRTHIATKGTVQSGLVLNLDTGVSTSYPGSGTAWTDLSGNANNATLVAGPTFNSSNGGNLIFDGVDDYGSIASSASLNFASGLSIESWFKFTVEPTVETPFVRKEIQYQLGLTTTNTIRCLIYTNGVTGWTAANDVTYDFITNTWYCLAMAWNGTVMTIYLNGINIKTASVTGSILTNSNPVSLGKFGGNASLNGSMSTAKIYNRALSASEIQQNFNALRSRYSI
jgi:hypothetical protein